MAFAHQNHISRPSWYLMQANEQEVDTTVAKNTHREMLAMM
jgi:hypothetical protein